MQCEQSTRRVWPRPWRLRPPLRRFFGILTALQEVVKRRRRTRRGGGDSGGDGSGREDSSDDDDQQQCGTHTRGQHVEGVEGEGARRR